MQSLDTKSVQFAYRSKTLLRLNMHRQRTIPKKEYEKLAIAVHFLQTTQNLYNVKLEIL